MIQLTDEEWAEVEAELDARDAKQQACGNRPEGHDWGTTFSVGCGRRSPDYNQCNNCDITKNQVPWDQWIEIDEKQYLLALPDLYSCLANINTDKGWKDFIKLAKKTDNLEIFKIDCVRILLNGPEKLGVDNIMERLEEELHGMCNT